MKILFIRSGNNGIDPISTNQGNSLIKKGIEVKYYNLKGKGLIGYISNISKIRNTIKSINPDIIHTHYSFCGIATALTFTKKPIVASLMGSDLRDKKIFQIIVFICNQFFWKACIVKSNEMKNNYFSRNAYVIPNGVDLEMFYPMNKLEARNKLKLEHKDKIIFFAADPERIEKNFILAKQALSQLNFHFNIITANNISHSDMLYYYNAADVVMLTSLWEGSPNVIKEAAACNRPIVATDVGDIKENIGNIQGCFVTKNDPIEIAKKIIEAMKYDNTDGRNKISFLNSDKISTKIIDIYNLILKKKK